MDNAGRKSYGDHQEKFKPIVHKEGLNGMLYAVVLSLIASEGHRNVETEKVLCIRKYIGKNTMYNIKTRWS